MYTLKNYYKLNKKKKTFINSFIFFYLISKTNYKNDKHLSYFSYCCDYMHLSMHTQRSLLSRKLLLDNLSHARIN